MSQHILGEQVKQVTSICSEPIANPQSHLLVECGTVILDTVRPAIFVDDVKNSVSIIDNNCFVMFLAMLLPYIIPNR